LIITRITNVKNAKFIDEINQLIFDNQSHCGFVNLVSSPAGWAPSLSASACVFASTDSGLPAASGLRRAASQVVGPGLERMSWLPVGTVLENACPPAIATPCLAQASAGNWSQRVS